MESPDVLNVNKLPALNLLGVLIDQIMENATSHDRGGVTSLNYSKAEKIYIFV